MQRSGIFLFLLVAFAFSCLCQVSVQQSCAVSNSGTAVNNGIAVGAPKVYDNRSLTLMLDSLNDQLKSVQTIDSKTLPAALNLLQGYQSQDVSRQVTGQISPPQQPAVTGGTGAAAAGASIPAPPDLLTAPKFTPSFGQSAADLLSDQVDLSYQIFNIRMILDRSLSDRLLTQGDAKYPRLQAVVGINVSVDPPRDAEDSVAIVEITLRPAKPDTTSRMSLVSMMPQEKTYNSAALSQKSTAFGGSAVASIIAVGYSERRRGQNFYLFRDNDTTAFEEMTNPGGNELRFGWQFRPVLGRKSVSPGLRQMFAVISVPQNDKAGVVASYQMLASVRTYWRHYDRKNLTTVARNQIHWWAHRPPATEGTLPQPYCVDVPTTSDLQQALTPQISDVSWTPTGSKKVMVSIRGWNFFQETKVIFGDKVFDKPDNGLYIKSDQAMDVIADAADLVQADGSVLGRYGPAVPLAANKSAPDSLHISALSNSVTVGGYFDLYVEVNQVLDKTLPLISINGAPIAGPYGKLECVQQNAICQHAGTVVIIARVSTDLVKEIKGTVRLRYPFYGPNWDASFSFDSLEQQFELIRAGKVNAAKSSLWIRRKGDGFYPPDGKDKATWCWLLQLPGLDPVNLTGPGLCTTTPKSSGDTDFHLLTGFLAQLTAKNESLQAPQLLLVSPDGSPVILPIPEDKNAKKEATPPKQSFSLNQNDSARLEFKPESSEDIKKIVKAYADGIACPIETSPKGDTLFVSITRAVTAKPGQVEIDFRDAKNEVVAIRVLAIKCTECSAKGTDK
jgi:hypothetical protein